LNVLFSSCRRSLMAALLTPKPPGAPDDWLMFLTYMTFMSVVLVAGYAL